ncbi:hypothetical protein L7F22_021499 [Adiantum nelumboides]|nr:hypothetical protein [Adiantum nelumboides]
MRGVEMAEYGSHGEEGNYRGPHRDTQFDTMTLEPPVRMQETASKPALGGEALGAGYVPGGAVDVQTAGGPFPPGYAAGAAPPAPRATGYVEGARRMPRALVISSLILRVGALLSLIVAVALLASDSHDSATDDYGSASVSTFSSTRYALAAAIIGAVYSIYEIVSVSIRLARGHLLLPGKFSLFISYIGDQIVIVLLLTGASAAAATFKDLQDGEVCDGLGSFCGQGAGGIALMFLGFCFLAASLVISSYCFYKNRI